MLLGKAKLSKIIAARSKDSQAASLVCIDHDHAKREALHESPQPQSTFPSYFRGDVVLCCAVFARHCMYHDASGAHMHAQTPPKSRGQAWRLSLEQLDVCQASYHHPSIPTCIAACIHTCRHTCLRMYVRTYMGTDSHTNKQANRRTYGYCTY